MHSDSSQIPPKGDEVPGLKKFGQILVDEGHLTRDQVEEVLAEQEKKPEVPFGKIAIDRGFLTRDQLAYLLKRYGKTLPIGEMLINAQLITRSQLGEALVIQNREGGRLGEILVREGFVTEQDLYEVLGWQFNFPFVPLSHLEPDKSLKAYVNPAYAAQHRVVPIAVLGRRLTVALSDPTRTLCLQDLAGMTHLEIDAVLATESDVAGIYERLYGRELSKELANRRGGRFASTPGKIGWHDVAAQTIGEAEPGQSQQLYDDSSADTQPLRRGGVGIPDSEDVTASDITSSLEEELDLELVEEASLELPRSHYVHNAGDSPVVKTLVQKIIARALKLRASDIHFEINVARPRLRLRIDGVLHDHDIGGLSDVFKTNYRSVISRLKILSHMDISEKRRPQDGSFRLITRRSGKVSSVDFRLATLPSRFGEGMVVRILDQLKAPDSLENLGLTQFVLDRFKGLIQRPTGILLITGPTGSGKSSTLYAALRTLYRPELKILTAEDPIEFTHPGVCQAEVNPTIGNTFARYLRSFLRQDPDVIMLGEIRDSETAEMAMRAAQTGHLLMSTLHTNNATASIQRLLDLVDDPNGIASTLAGVMAQRLVRRVCRRCAEPKPPPAEILKEWFLEPPADVPWLRGKGCDLCNNSGYSGRIAIAELWIPRADEVILINKRASAESLRTSALKQMPSLAEDALLKAMLGTTTLEEALRVVPYEDVVQVRRSGKDHVRRMEEVRRMIEDAEAATDVKRHAA